MTIWAVPNGITLLPISHHHTKRPHILAAHFGLAGPPGAIGSGLNVAGIFKWKSARIKKPGITPGEFWRRRNFHYLPKFSTIALQASLTALPNVLVEPLLIESPSLLKTAYLLSFS